MDRNASDLHVLAAAMLEPAGREARLAERSAGVGIAGHALVAKIENAIGQWSTAVSPRLEGLFHAAELAAAKPPAAMVDYLERASDESDDEDERRRGERATLLATVTAIPLSLGFEPCGEPFKAVARDASEGGVSLLHTRAVTAERLALRWQQLASPGRIVTVMLHVQRCRPMGPFYELAGEFMRAD